MLRNAEEYSFKKDIYDYLYIDSLETQIRYFDKDNGIVTILSTYHFLNNITYSEKKELKEFQQAIEFLEREADIFFESTGTIFGESNYNSRNVNYLYLKGNRIYVYRSRYKDIYELNEFVRKFFKEKDFKRSAIRDERRRITQMEYVGTK